MNEREQMEMNKLEAENAELRGALKRPEGLIAKAIRQHGHDEGRRAGLRECSEIISGFIWLMDEGFLVRSITRDHEPDYMMRSLRLTAWLQKAVAVNRAAEGE